MQNNIQIFESSEFGKVRVVQIEEQPWWVLKDICYALGLNSPHKVAERLDEDERNQIPLTDALGRKQRTFVVSESGLYAVILRSDKPKAKEFRKWITSDVLPSIRKHGAYISDDLLDNLIENPESAMKLFAKLKEERAQKEALEGCVEKLMPKAHYYDVILQCPSAVLTTVIAKDYGLTAVMFNKLLHALGIQFRYKTNKTWVLYHEHDNKGYTITNTYYRNGCAYIHMYWTQKGRLFLYEFLAGYGILPQQEITGAGS